MMLEASSLEREALSTISFMLCHAFLLFSSSRSKSIISKVFFLTVATKTCYNSDFGR